ncbi:MFS transporter [Sphaerisporangium rufum]|uniref:MFS transporter n=1 Tax=Sphaerisporangium rufum TaxID=1381558 RepID=A0A919R017_9ACTN|nr:MFS transporter [Sphaerisporangium rufum]GII77147.1 MFS transporter [Sphaerisporangium rufum]
MASDPSTAPAAPPARGLARLVPADPVLRRLALISLVTSFGNGLTMTVSVLFFTRSLGFGVAQVGAGLTAAGICGIVAGVPAGRAADRWGSRRVLIVLTLVQAAGMAGYALVRSFPAFLLLLCAVMAVDRGASAVRGALYADVLPRETLVRGRAYLRAVTNVAIGVGASLAALALQADTREAYLTAIMVDAVTFALVAPLLLGLPATRRAAPPGRSPGRAGDGGPRRGTVLRDRPYLAVTALNGITCLQFAMIEVAVPLWIAQETHAPRATVAAVLVVNTVLVVLLQVRATRNTGTPATAARTFTRGGLLLAVSCLVFAAAAGLPAAAAAAVLLAGVALQALGEVFSQAGGWALSYDLAEESAHGAYQGVFLAGLTAAQTLGPALITATAITYGLPGWAGLAVLFAAAALAMPATARWAARAARAPLETIG